MNTSSECLTKHGSLWLDWWVLSQLQEGQDTHFACPCCLSLLNQISPEMEGELWWLAEKKNTQTRESELLSQVWGSFRDARFCRHFREWSTLLGFIPKIQALLRFLISCSTNLTLLTRTLALLNKLWSKQWIFSCYAFKCPERGTQAVFTSCWTYPSPCLVLCLVTGAPL